MLPPDTVIHEFDVKCRACIEVGALAFYMADCLGLSRQYQLDVIAVRVREFIDFNAPVTVGDAADAVLSIYTGMGYSPEQLMFANLSGRQRERGAIPLPAAVEDR